MDLLKPVSVSLAKNCGDLLAKQDHKLTLTKTDTKTNIHLTSHEVEGLKKLIRLIQKLPRNKWNVPNDIVEPDELLNCSKVCFILFWQNNSSDKKIL